MAEMTTYQQTSNDRAEQRAQIREMFAEMDRPRAAMEQSRENMKRMDVDIDARMAGIDALLERLAKS